MRPQPIGCGNVLISSGRFTGGTASMRPQPIGCGNRRPSPPPRPSTRRFNEAAADRLRKRARRIRRRRRDCRFNEAAADRLRKQYVGDKCNENSITLQ